MFGIGAGKPPRLAICLDGEEWLMSSVHTEEAAEPMLPTELREGFPTAGL